jgi:hypothetical protein
MLIRMRNVLKFVNARMMVTGQVVEWISAYDIYDFDCEVMRLGGNHRGVLPFSRHGSDL